MREPGLEEAVLGTWAGAREWLLVCMEREKGGYRCLLRSQGREAAGVAEPGMRLPPHSDRFPKAGVEPP
jgi:hypothetical protein